MYNEHCNKICCGDLLDFATDNEHLKIRTIKIILNHGYVCTRLIIDKLIKRYLRHGKDTCDISKVLYYFQFECSNQTLKFEGNDYIRYYKDRLRYGPYNKDTSGHSKYNY